MSVGKTNRIRHQVQMVHRCVCKELVEVHQVRECERTEQLKQKLLIFMSWFYVFLLDFTNPRLSGIYCPRLSWMYRPLLSWKKCLLKISHENNQQKFNVLEKFLLYEPVIWVVEPIVSISRSSRCGNNLFVDCLCCWDELNFWVNASFRCSKATSQWRNLFQNFTLLNKIEL